MRELRRREDMRLDPLSPEASHLLAQAKVHEMLANLDALAKQHWVTPYFYAMIYVGLKGSSFRRAQSSLRSALVVYGRNRRGPQARLTQV